VLGRWFELLAAREEGGLEGLSIITKSSGLINDCLLQAWAPFLSSLIQLSLVACTRVTHEGVLSLLRAAAHHSLLTDKTSRPGINHLCLDHLDHLNFALLQPYMPALLPKLAFLSVTLDSGQVNLPSFLSPFSDTLTALHIPNPSILRSSLLETLPPQGLPHLKLFSLPSNLRSIQPTTLAADLLPNLQHLFLPGDRSSLHDLLSLVKELDKTLQSLHIVSTPGAADQDLMKQDLPRLAMAGGNLRQIGMRTKVYEVCSLSLSARCAMRAVALTTLVGLDRSFEASTRRSLPVTSGIKRYSSFHGRTREERGYRAFMR
jgi:hypothetical protein